MWISHNSVKIGAEASLRAEFGLLSIILDGGWLQRQRRPNWPRHWYWFLSPIVVVSGKPPWKLASLYLNHSSEVSDCSERRKHISLWVQVENENVTRKEEEIKHISIHLFVIMDSQYEASNQSVCMCCFCFSFFCVCVCVFVLVFLFFLLFFLLNFSARLANKNYCNAIKFRLINALSASFIQRLIIWCHSTSTNGPATPNKGPEKRGCSKMQHFPQLRW